MKLSSQIKTSKYLFENTLPEVVVVVGEEVVVVVGSIRILKCFRELIP